MRSRKVLFWMLLAVDVVLVALLVLIICAIMMALAAFAAGIEEWPLFACLGLTMCVACTGLIFSRRYPGPGSRRVGFALHGTALCLCLIVVLSIGWMWFHAVRRRFLLPAGFQGEVYLLHVRDGAGPGKKSWWRTTYQVEADGFATTTDPPIAPGQAFLDEYDYVEPGGHLQELQDVGPGTLPDTPENRNDRSQVYTYFARTGGPATTYYSGGGHRLMDQCFIGDDEISIGTKAYLLARHRPTDLDAYFAQHPKLCAK